MKGREKSDRRIVPRNGGNAPGGKAATASEVVEQLELFAETADSPKGDVAGADLGRPRPAARAVPKSANTTRRAQPTEMTIEEVKLSHCTAAHRGLRNAYFADRGLMSLEKQWKELQPRIFIAVPKQLELLLG